MKRTKYTYLIDSEPTTGKFKKDFVIFNSNPTPGGNVGWSCIQDGTACNIAWATTADYTIGNHVSSNGKVYECIVGGTSSAIAPKHTTSQAVDGTITWLYIDTLAIFKTWGTIEQ